MTGCTSRCHCPCFLSGKHFLLIFISTNTQLTLGLCCDDVFGNFYVVFTVSEPTLAHTNYFTVCVYSTYNISIGDFERDYCGCSTTEHAL